MICMVGHHVRACITPKINNRLHCFSFRCYFVHLPTVCFMEFTIWPYAAKTPSWKSCAGMHVDVTQCTTHWYMFGQHVQGPHYRKQKKQQTSSPKAVASQAVASSASASASVSKSTSSPSSKSLNVLSRMATGQPYESLANTYLTNP